MNILIIIPAYNEAENIVGVVESLKKYAPQYNYIVVNDGSTDKTGEICRDHHYPTLDLPINLGLAGAFQAGIKYAWRHGYQGALQLDGDGQHDPRYLCSMVEHMKKYNLDIVVGSRFCNNKKPVSLRMLGSRLISMAIYLTTGTHISDPTSGMRLFNQKMLKEFSRDIQGTPEPDSLSYFLRCGAGISEIPVTMYDRKAGTSYLDLERSIRYMFNMCISILFIQFFRPRRTI